MSTTSGKEHGYNRSMTAGLDYVSAPSPRGIGEAAVYGFALGGGS